MSHRSHVNQKLDLNTPDLRATHKRVNNSHVHSNRPRVSSFVSNRLRRKDSAFCVTRAFKPRNNVPHNSKGRVSNIISTVRRVVISLPPLMPKSHIHSKAVRPRSSKAALRKVVRRLVFRLARKDNNKRPAAPHLFRSNALFRVALSMTL